jgi:type IV pilus assembly protein PilB
VVNARIREAVNQRVTTRAVHELAVAEGMTPLLQDGLERARRGETSLTEVLRVAG